MNVPAYNASMDRSGSTGEWRLDESENALDYLEEAIRHVMEAQRNPWAWKWVTIAIHGALYGFGVCAVTGTNYDRVTWRTKKGELKLDSFDTILKKCCDEKWMNQYTGSRTLVLTKEQKDAIRFLKDGLRNRLEHYVPGLWYVGLEGLPSMIASILGVIEFLAVDSGNVRFRNPQNARERVRALCEAGRSLLSTMSMPSTSDP